MIRPSAQRRNKAKNRLHQRIEPIVPYVYNKRTLVDEERVHKYQTRSRVNIQYGKPRNNAIILTQEELEEIRKFCNINK